jgi:Family of unknown function (DUF6338)
MPNTFQAIAVVALALLPGALAVWAFERTAGRWTSETSDRVLRFAGVSAVFLAILAPLAYYLYATRVQNRYLEQGKSLSWWFWLGALAYVVVPYAIGRFLGIGAKAGWPWLRRLIGPQPVPRAWDYAFLAGRNGWIRLRLKDPPKWIVGAWATLEDGRESFASPFPQPEALFLIRTVECDPNTGEFLYGPDNQVILRPEALLVRWEEVQYLEFIDG